MGHHIAEKDAMPSKPEIIIIGWVFMVSYRCGIYRKPFLKSIK